MPAPARGTEGFQSLLRAVGDGWCWAKLSGAHRLSRDAPDYPDARPFHEALVRANPERLVWGGDWPHPRVEGEMPDAGHLFELFQTWTPDQATAAAHPRHQSRKALWLPELKVAPTMSVNNKRVFYVKYLAQRDLCRHPAGATRRAARPARERKPRGGLGADPGRGACLSDRRGARRTGAAFPRPSPICCGARRTC